MKLDDRPLNWMRSTPVYHKITAVLKVTALYAVHGLVKYCLAALTGSTLSYRAKFI